MARSLLGRGHPLPPPPSPPKVTLPSSSWKPTDWTVIPFVPGLYYPFKKIFRTAEVRVVTKPNVTVFKATSSNKFTYDEKRAYQRDETSNVSPPPLLSCQNLKEAISDPVIDCQRNVVYALKCSSCPEFYVGQCRRAAGKRKHDHATAIRDSKLTNALAVHAEKNNHSINMAEMKIIHTEPTEKIRLGLEAYSIVANADRVVNLNKCFPPFKKWAELANKYVAME
jgi:hypothetical protein